MRRQNVSPVAPYRPITPNEHWQAGAAAHRGGVERDCCTLTYPGSRWAWEAGWDYAYWREVYAEVEK